MHLQSETVVNVYTEMVIVTVYTKTDFVTCHREIVVGNNS